MTKPAYAIGVDVGGTFTDVFLLDETTGAIATAKVPSTRGDQSKGFVEGISGRVADFGDIKTIVHGTTVGTNALLERKGAQTGIITTEGFRDVLEMRRRDRPATWGLKGSFTPVVDRRDRLEVRERVLADGSILEPVDLDAVRTEARALLENGCQSVCVFFINGYANPANEALAVEAVRSVWPNPYVTAATEILPEIREFERLSTATLNAYLQPVVSSYLDRLEHSLEARDFNGDILIVQSNGGVMSVETAKRYPVRTALSGPAAGVIAATAIAGAAGFDNIITCDMGGTSFDVSLVAGGQAALAAQTSIDFGLVVRTPMIEITTIGAGGGSIAWVDSSGLLQVGPKSAGSDPGPVCYGLGNTQPTVTDANVVCGRINAERPIGGKLARLDVEAARAAIASQIAAPLGLQIEEAAEAILKLATAKMAGAIRLVSIEKGHDPAKFAAMPFGGGGGLHTGALIKEVGLGSALVPRFPGVTSALGCVVADMRHDRVQTVNRLLDQTDAAALGEEMAGVAADTGALLSASGISFERIDRVYELDMLYVGQTHTVSVEVHMPEGGLTREAIAARFDAAYREAYGRLLENIPRRVMNYRVSVIGRRRKLDMKVFAPVGGRPAPQCLLATRRIFADGSFMDAGVYDRLALETGASIMGPALLEQADSTVFVDPGLCARVDDFGNLVITPGESTMAGKLDLRRAALLIVDLQNDFLHPDGAYARGGQSSRDIAALPGRILPVAEALRGAGGAVVSTQFTLVPGRDGEPMISPHLKKLRPFLRKGDFAPGSWGQALVDVLQPADFTVEKVAYSAFYMTRLEWVLRKAGIDALLVCGIVTNGGVASTVRDAHVRDFSTIVLSDGCAAFSREVHERAIGDLSTVSTVASCASALEMIAGS